MRAPVVLCYHAASESWDDELSVPPARIEATVARLVRRRRVHVTFDDAYGSIAEVAPALVGLGAQVTVFACTALADDGGVLDVPELADQVAAHPDELRTMTWDELAALRDAGVAIGSHTVTHPHLPELAPEELERELVESRETIRARLGVECNSLAYPYGEHDASVRAAAARAGYAQAFGLSVPEEASPFAVPRIDLYRRDGTFVTRLKVSPLRPVFVAALDATGIRRGRRPR